ncbi:LysR family transcriptional regulator [Micromonospora sp. NPDC049240]|uniref:LysR family transcriptional regulator n=1 Tax=Micromonospora sp. NPDC049240 TaxID=3155151 RepID=UPI00340A5970
MEIDAVLLTTLRTVKRERSVPRAAASLHVHRTVVGRRLSLLESRLGIELVHRGTGELTLTPAAQILVSEAERMHEHSARALNRARRAATRFTRMPRTLGIAILDDRISHELTALGAALTMPGLADRVAFRRYPYADLLETVRDGRCELAVGWSPTRRSALRGLRAVAWGRFPRMVLAPSGHSIIAGASCLISQLKDQPLLGFDAKVGDRAAHYWTLGRQRRRTTRSGAELLRCRSRHLDEHYELVGAGVALAVAPAPLADSGDARHAAVPIRDLAPATRMLVWNAAHENTLGLTVRRFLTDQQSPP